ncbi:hypothetical protein [Algicella marina]|uniref:Uncharacterized protein n=1 Tax=Algicella marina TaxID=2683284 RepID=A0A6P1T3V7_9RHOB|nr:hypothetical protein [Algicella marina]QHQ35202.1 hypothetical protein GO499_08305 [Algicella marina]
MAAAAEATGEKVMDAAEPEEKAARRRKMCSGQEKGTRDGCLLLAALQLSPCRTGQLMQRRLGQRKSAVKPIRRENPNFLRMNLGAAQKKCRARRRGQFNREEVCKTAIEAVCDSFMAGIS